MQHIEDLNIDKDNITVYEEDTILDRASHQERLQIDVILELSTK